MAKNKLSICYFGNYDRDYPRNSILLKGLKANKVNVIEINFNFEKRFLKRMASYFLAILRAFQKRKEYNYILIGHPWHSEFLVGYILKVLMKKRLVFDIFVSCYETIVLDRNILDKNSFQAKKLLFTDQLFCKLADIVLIDTLDHRDFLVNLLHINKKKFRIIPVGADDKIFHPKINKSKKQFTVLFYGSYAPLQGAEQIAKAAELINDKEVKFRMIGDGQKFNQVKGINEKSDIQNLKLIKNWISYRKLAKEINQSDICLGGPFGYSEKAKIVIPNKTYQALASKRAVIVGNTPANRKIFDKKEVIFSSNNPRNIAQKINYYKKRKRKLTKIATNGYLRFKKDFTPFIIGKKLRRALEEIQNE